MSISSAFKLDPSAVFFHVLLLSVLKHVAVHTVVWHVCFRKKIHSYAIAFIYNDNLQFICLNLVQFSKLSNISDLTLFSTLYNPC